MNHLAQALRHRRDDLAALYLAAGALRALRLRRSPEVTQTGPVAGPDRPAGDDRPAPQNRRSAPPRRPEIDA